MLPNLSICTPGLASTLSDSMPIIDVNNWRISSSTPHQTDSASHEENSLEDILHSLNSSSIEFGVVATTPEVVLKTLPYASLFYVPGEFSRQADLLDACVASKKRVWVERGAFLGIADLAHIAEKLSGSEGGVVESGSAHGYGDRALDPRVFAFARSLGLPILLNVSHLINCPGSRYPWATNWQKEMDADQFVKAGLALGASGFVCDARQHPKLAQGGLLAAQRRALTSLRDLFAGGQSYE